MDSLLLVVRVELLPMLCAVQQRARGEPGSIRWRFARKENTPSPATNLSGFDTAAAACGWCVGYDGRAVRLVE
jgi:hypothetical protein